MRARGSSGVCSIVRPDGVRIGMPVTVVFEQRAGFGAMPNFSAQTR